MKLFHSTKLINLLTLVLLDFIAVIICICMYACIYSHVLKLNKI